MFSSCDHAVNSLVISQRRQFLPFLFNWVNSLKKTTELVLFQEKNEEKDVTFLPEWSNKHELDE